MTRETDVLRRERESRALQLVDAVLDLAPAERRRVLEQRSGNDAALRAAALGLLEACEVAEGEAGLFSQTAGALAAPLIDAVRAAERDLSAETLPVLQRALAGRYEITRELGRGGSAIVFLARDLRHQSEVAIKVIRQGVDDSALRSRFQQEIVLSARLHHPYVVPLLDSGDVDGVPYFVMPYVAGESLRQRLDTTGALALDEVIAITRDVAEALDFAHKSGVIHRDIKPQNILLSEGHAIVADFGIAIALDHTLTSRLTETGLVVGTPLYMAPEQASSEQEVGPRADVYSLGCVVYEMLTGEPPFTGSSPRAVIAKHAAAPPPDVSVVRSWSAHALDAVVRRALAKMPADRYSTAGDFFRALDVAAKAHQAGPRRPWLGAGAALAGTVAIALFARTWTSGSQPPRVAADTSVIAVFPLIGSAGDTASTRALSAAVHDAVAKWGGLRVVDPAAMGAFEVPATSRLWNVGPASAFAAGQGAGRFLWGDVAGEGDSLRLHLRLSTVAAGGVVVADQVVHLPDSPAGTMVLGEKVDALLIRAPVQRWSATWEASRSLPAQQAYARAGTYFASWTLDSARAALEDATRYDGSFGTAHLWLALSRVWSGEPTARYSVAAVQANLHSSAMSPREREYTRAVLLESRNDLGAACQAWRGLALADSADFVGWYGAARCHRRDLTVVRDSRSPSGWRFRSSFRQAVQEFQAAFRLHPTILHSFAEASFEPLRTMLLAGSSVYIGGLRDDGDTTRYFARMTTQADTIAFIPYAGAQSLLAPMGRERARGVMTQRQVLRDIMATWVSAEPRSAEARAGLAMSLALTGDAGALDTIRVARSLAVNADEALHIALTDTWMRVAAGVANQELDLLKSARQLGDSLLTHATASRSSERRQLVALAALFGRSHLAAALGSTAELGRRIGAPAFALTDALPYLTYAALGGPVDSLAERRRRIARQLQREPDAAARKEGLDLLLRGATLCFPWCDVSPYSESRRGDYLLDMQLDFADSAFASVREKLMRLASTTRPMDLPQDFTFDTIVPEADLFLRMGDPAAAIARLEPTMTRLFLASPSRLGDPIEAASLARALRLRVEAARQLGDRTEAQRWERMLELLTGADGR